MSLKRFLFFCLAFGILENMAIENTLFTIFLFLCHNHLMRTLFEGLPVLEERNYVFYGLLLNLFIGLFERASVSSQCRRPDSTRYSKGQTNTLRYSLCHENGSFSQFKMPNSTRYSKGETNTFLFISD